MERKTIRFTTIPISLELYQEVMRNKDQEWDYLFSEFGPIQDSFETRQYIRRFFNQVDSPVTGTTAEQNHAFVVELNQVTGRKFQIPDSRTLQWASRLGKLPRNPYLPPGKVDPGEILGFSLWNDPATVFENHPTRKGEIKPLSKVWVRSSDNKVFGTSEMIADPRYALSEHTTYHFVNDASFLVGMILMEEMPTEELPTEL
jgi:hypothetical protein